jgi:hypothetical protein
MEPRDIFLIVGGAFVFVGFGGAILWWLVGEDLFP